MNTILYSKKNQSEFINTLKNIDENVQCNNSLNFGVDVEICIFDKHDNMQHFIYLNDGETLVINYDSYEHYSVRKTNTDILTDEEKKVLAKLIENAEINLQLLREDNVDNDIVNDCPHYFHFEEIFHSNIKSCGVLDSLCDKGYIGLICNNFATNKDVYPTYQEAYSGWIIREK